MKNTSTIVFAVGMILLAVFLGADGLGIGRQPGLGPQQAVGALVGAVIAIVGFAMKK
jgi:ABC-type proline/glycine betaine transport system permease subunit